MSTLDDLKALRKKLASERDNINTSITTLDRIIERLSKPENAGRLFPTVRIPFQFQIGKKVISAEVRDMADYVADAKDKLDFTIDDLVEEKDFIASLTTPHYVEDNLGAVWGSAITRLLISMGSMDTSTIVTLHDRSLAIAEGRDKELAITSLTFKQKTGSKKSAPVETHIVVNKDTHSAVVIGDSQVSKRAYELLLENGVTYISRNDAHAAQKTDAALKTLTAQFTKSACEALTSAALYRIAGESTDNLETLLSKQAPEITYNKYVVKTPTVKR